MNGLKYVVLLCGYCRSREVKLTGEAAEEWVQADEERKPHHLCATCVETCKAYAKQQREHAEWVADGSPR